MIYLTWNKSWIQVLVATNLRCATRLVLLICTNAQTDYVKVQKMPRATQASADRHGWDTEETSGSWTHDRMGLLGPSLVAGGSFTVKDRRKFPQGSSCRVTDCRWSGGRCGVCPFCGADAPSMAETLILPLWSLCPNQRGCPVLLLLRAPLHGVARCQEHAGSRDMLQMET